MPSLPLPSAPLGLTPTSKTLPTSTPGIHCDHDRRADVGAHLAGLVLGVVIQAGPRRRPDDRIPRSPRADIGRRSAVSISQVAADRRGTSPPEAAIQVTGPRVDVVTAATDPQLSRWDNEGRRIPDPPLRRHRRADLLRSVA